MPELPRAKRARFMDELGLPAYDASILTADRETSEFFEMACGLYGGDTKRVSNWMMNEVLRVVNEKGVSLAELPIRAEDLVEIIKLVDAKTINTSTGKSLVDKVLETGKKPGDIVRELGLGLVSDEGAIREVCRKIVDGNPKEVAAYRGGKETLIGWFVGQVMKEMRGKADPEMAKAILSELLRG